MSYKRHMHQEMTYWPPAGNDGFGGKLFGDPVTLKCRWEDKAVLFRDAQGREAVSDAVIYPDQPLALNGYAARGDVRHAEPLKAGKEIRAVQNSPSLNGKTSLNKVIL